GGGGDPQQGAEVGGWGARAAAALVLAFAQTALAACADPSKPLQATLRFQNAPADVTFAAADPISVVVQVENCSGGPVLTTDGFSATDFSRRLYFTDPSGGIV